MPLEADAVQRHALALQVARQPVHGVGLGAGAVGVVVVDVQLGVRVGRVRGAQRIRDVRLPHGVVERGAPEGAVVVEGLVDHVPGVDLALVVADFLGDVVLHGRLELAGRQAAHPAGQLVVPDQGVTAYALVVGLGEVDDLVAAAEVELALLRLGGVPLHRVAGRDHAELAAQDGGVRGVGEFRIVGGRTEVAALGLRQLVQGARARRESGRGRSDGEQPGGGGDEGGQRAHEPLAARGADRFPGGGRGRP